MEREKENPNLHRCESCGSSAEMKYRYECSDCGMLVCFSCLFLKDSRVCSLCWEMQVLESALKRFKGLLFKLGDAR